MIKSLLLLLCIVPCLVWGQPHAIKDSIGRIKISETFWAKPGAVYIDSMEVNIEKIFLDPQNILSVEVVKRENLLSGAMEAMLIAREEKVPFITIAGMAEETINKYKGPFHFIIDNKHVIDTAGVLIEPSAIESIDIIGCSSTVTDPHLCHGTTIYLKTKLYKIEAFMNSYIVEEKY